MITCREYLADRTLKRDYYSQYFIKNDPLTKLIREVFPMNQILTNYETNNNWIFEDSVQEHLKDLAGLIISLERNRYKELFEKYGDQMNLGGMVCILQYLIEAIQTAYLRAIDYDSITLELAI